MSKRRYGSDAKLYTIADSIRNGIREVKEKNESGDYSQVMTWVIDGKLACAARPLRYHHIHGGSGRMFPSEARPELDRWVRCVKAQDIASMICLVSQKELRHYRQLLPETETLIDYYRNHGFNVCHLSWSDPAHSGYLGLKREVEAKRPLVLEAYDSLPKPVLVHCSAAIDRSPPVVAYVVFKRGENSG